MPRLTDWVVEFQVDTRKVDKAIAGFDRKFAKLGMKGQGSVEAKMQNMATKQMQLTQGRAATEKRFADAKTKAEVQAHIDNKRRSDALAKQQIRDRFALHKASVAFNKKEAGARRKATPADKDVSFSARRTLGQRIERGTQVAGTAAGRLRGDSGAAATKTLEELRKKQSQLRKVQAQLTSGAKLNTKAYQSMVRQVDTLNKSISSLNKQSQAVSKQFNATRFATSGLTRSLHNLATSYVSVFAAAQAGVGTLGIGKEMDTLRASFLAASGGAEQAGVDFEFVRQTSQVLGRDLIASAKGFQQIGAAAIAANISAEDTREIFLGASEAATSLGLGVDDTKGIFRAFSQIMSKGTVQSEELRNQIGERLPGAFATAARAMGVTTQELSKMMEQGQLTADEILPKFAKELRKTARETGALAAGMKTIVAAQARLKNVFTLGVESFFGAGFGEGLAEVLNSFTNNIKRLIPIFKLLGMLLEPTMFILARMLDIINLILLPFALLADTLADIGDLMRKDFNKELKESVGIVRVLVGLWTIVQGLVQQAIGGIDLLLAKYQVAVEEIFSAENSLLDLFSGEVHKKMEARVEASRSAAQTTHKNNTVQNNITVNNPDPVAAGVEVQNAIDRSLQGMFAGAE